MTSITRLRTKTTFAMGVSTVALIVAGCTGGLDGMVRQSGDRVEMSYQDSGFGQGNLTAKLGDGELFEGKFVEVTTATQGTSFATTPAGANGFAIVTNYTGNIDAVLFGDRKHTMRCRFRTADATLGMPSGGVGVCEVSDGRVIDVQF